MVRQTIERPKVRKIVEKVPDEVLQRDLEKYRQRAVELGATDAKIITTDMVVIDERVRAKCMYPRCPWYGTSVNCPPYTIELEQAIKLVNSFRYAIFFKIEVPIETVAGKLTHQQTKQGRLATKTRNEVVAKVEAEAFYDGYYLAVGFGGGSCKRFFCPKEDCSALKGQGCRNPYRARASMEGVGMNVFMMATKVGWDIYPIGFRPSNAPYGLRTGIVFIY